MKKDPVVMLVEDEPDTLNILSRFFSLKGFNVRETTCAIDAFTSVNKEVDIIVTDLEMPGLNGSDLCLMVKQKYNIPVILLTGVLDLDLSDYENNFDDVLYKPIEPVPLMDSVWRNLLGYEIIW